MSEWQKVRVQFTDADGNEVLAVMWQAEAYPNAAYFKPDHSAVGGCLQWDEDLGVKVTPIRKLPSGVGAVIRVTASNDRFKIYGDSRDVFVSDVSGKWWYSSDGDTFADTAMDGWEYEVLSEGIKL